MAGDTTLGWAQVLGSWGQSGCGERTRVLSLAEGPALPIPFGALTGPRSGQSCDHWESLQGPTGVDKGPSQPSVSLPTGTGCHLPLQSHLLSTPLAVTFWESGSSVPTLSPWGAGYPSLLPWALSAFETASLGTWCCLGQ